jgi:hypothetical protein
MRVLGGGGDSVRGRESWSAHSCVHGGPWLRRRSSAWDAEWNVVRHAFPSIEVDVLASRVHIRTRYNVARTQLQQRAMRLLHAVDRTLRAGRQRRLAEMHVWSAHTPTTKAIQAESSRT